MSRNKHKRWVKTALEQEKDILCDNLDFSAEEAYKLLRTNLIYSFTDSEHCKIIGITSTSRDEGKSTTAINLAYTIAKSKKYVLLIDGDMRLPTISKRLGMRSSPGLSNLLIGESKFEDVLQCYGKDNLIYFISAGSLPPNPSELLGSEKMADWLTKLRDTKFDYIIVDMPPVDIVSDALLMSKHVNGYLFVVKQGQTSKHDFNEAMRKINIVSAKILGFVMTNAESGKKYYRYKKGYGYGYKYGYGHKSYEKADADRRKSQDKQ